MANKLDNLEKRVKFKKGQSGNPKGSQKKSNLLRF